MLPAPTLSPCDEHELTVGPDGTCRVCRPCMMPPAGPPSPSDRHALDVELVRDDLAARAEEYGLACVRRVILVACTEEEWDDVAKSFEREDLPGLRRYDVRGASDAAGRMAARDLHGAIAALAEVEGWSVEQWLENARKGAGEATSGGAQ